MSVSCDICNLKGNTWPTEVLRLSSFAALDHIFITDMQLNFAYKSMCIGHQGQNK